jgi:hypothetical protein
MSMTDGQRSASDAQLSLGLDEEPAAWHVRRSPRARRLSVRVYPGGRVEVVVPRGVGARLVQRFVLGHRTWIARKVDEMRTLAPVAVNRLPQDVELAAVGERWLVHRTDIRALGAAVSDGLLLVLPERDEKRAYRILHAWLRARARYVLEPWLRRVAGEIGIDFERLEIRRQCTRWGSCSRSGAISLNVCLLFQRSEVVRYLLVHELCHRRHMNHSRHFWALVGRHEPSFRSLDGELGQGWRQVPDWVFRDLRAD